MHSVSLLPMLIPRSFVNVRSFEDLSRDNEVDRPRNFARKDEDIFLSSYGYIIQKRKKRTSNAFRYFQMKVQFTDSPLYK